MSLFAKFFGGRKDEAPSADEAIQRLLETEEMLKKKSDFLEKKIEEQIGVARKHGTKNKRMALMALKRKKNLEKQLLQIDGTLSTIELQREALCSATSNTEIIKVMGEAAKALKKVNQGLDVDSVHDLIDEMAEQQDISKEISDAISKPTGIGLDFDEEELMAELDLLEQEDLDDQLVGVPTAVDNLPDVPIAEPVKNKKKPRHTDSEDLDELESWALS